MNNVMEIGHLLNIDNNHQTAQDPFLSSADYVHNAPRNIEGAILMTCGTAFLVLFQIIFGMYGEFPLLMSSVSSLAGVVLGITMYCFPTSYSRPVLYLEVAENAAIVEPAERVELKNAA